MALKTRIKYKRFLKLVMEKKKEGRTFLLSEGNFERSPCTCHSSNVETAFRFRAKKTFFFCFIEQPLNWTYKVYLCPFCQKKVVVVPSLEIRSAIGVHLHTYNRNLQKRVSVLVPAKSVGFMKGSNIVTVLCTSQTISNNGVFSKLTVFSFSLSFKFVCSSVL